MAAEGRQGEFASVVYIPKQNSILDERRGGSEMGRLENNNNIGSLDLFRYSAVMTYFMTLSKYLLIND